MSPKRIFSLIKSGRLLLYVVGRFRLLRNAYSFYRRWFCRKPSQSLGTETVFPSIQPVESAKQLTADAIALGFNLSEDLTREIYGYAKSSPCYREGLEEDFYFRDIENGRLPSGEKVALGHVRKPHECPAIARIKRDPVLWETVTKYLGYVPRRSDTRLFWSFASDLTDSERRELAQTIDFHIDVYSYKFCYGHWYIVDTDRDAGAHELIRGSHHRKRLGHLFGSARRSRSALEGVYPKEDFMVVEGPAGSGFLEDTSCFHRAIPPLTKDRLLLQLRFI